MPTVLFVLGRTINLKNKLEALKQTENDRITSISVSAFFAIVRSSKKIINIFSFRHLSRKIKALKIKKVIEESAKFICF
jgi:hypothetical protein